MGCSTRHVCNVSECFATARTHSLSQVLWSDVMECTDIRADSEYPSRLCLHDLVQLDAAMGGGAQQHMAVGACMSHVAFHSHLLWPRPTSSARRLAPARTWPVFCQAWSSSLSQTPCPFWTRVIASESSSCAPVSHFVTVGAVEYPEYPIVLEPCRVRRSGGYTRACRQEIRFKIRLGGLSLDRQQVLITARTHSSLRRRCDPVV